MALRISLQIEGDASGAKRAVDETTTAVRNLNTEATKRMQTNEDAALRQRTAAQTSVADQAAIEASAKRTTTAVRETGAATTVVAGNFANMRTIAIGALAGIAGSAGIGLVVGALSGLAVIAGEWAFSIINSGPEIERTLKAHEEIVGRIADAYRRAQGAASDYGNDSRAGLTFDAQANVQRLEGAYKTSVGDLGPGFGWDGVGLGLVDPLMDAADPLAGLGPFRETVTAFRQDIKDGVADVIAFRNNIAEIASALPADSPFRQLAVDLRETTAPAADLQAELQRSVDLFKALTGDAAAAGAALGDSSAKFTLTGEAAEGALPFLSEYDRLLAQIAGRDPLPTGTGIGALSGQAISGRATGGFISGPGSGTSDSILALVSNGEYVVNAAATARNRPLLDAINGGSLPGFASGGIVPRFATGGAVATGGSSFGGVDISQELGLLSGAVRDFTQSLRQGASFTDAFGQALQRLSDRALDAAFGALDNLLVGDGSSGGGLLGSLFSSLFGVATGSPMNLVGTGHSGAANIGAVPATRLVPAAIFAGAPRMHGGGTLGREVPFLGLEGEEIGWPEDLARKYGGAPTINNVYVSTPDPRSFAQNRSLAIRGAGRVMGQVGRHT